MTTFVQIVVNVPAVSGTFDYTVPDSLLGHVGVGHLVVAPFGKQTVQGVVFRFIDQPSVPDVKEIIELVDRAPVMTQVQMSLAETMAASTFSSLASIVSLFLPVGLSQEADVLYRAIDNRPLTTPALAPGAGVDDGSLSVVQRRLLDLLTER